MEERDHKNRANFLPQIECDSAKPSVRSRKDIYPTGLKNCLLLQGVRTTKAFGLVTGWVLFLGQKDH